MLGDELRLKIHLDERGTVWYLLGNSQPVCSGRDTISFMLLPIVHNTKSVGMLGTAENAHLISAMYSLKLSHKLTSVKVVSPTMFTPHQRRTPGLALLEMRRVQQPASTGGWHEVELHDYHTYALVSQIRKSGSVDDHSLRLLRSHAVWPALSFVPTLDTTAVCKLLAQVIDPRWYVDAHHPSRAARLSSYLGLKPRVQAAVDSDGAACRGFTRCSLVRASWQRFKPNAEALKLPANFLWRIKVLAGSDPRADLRASQQFVSYMYYTWLDALYATKQKEPLFAPEHFFKRPDEVRAFRQHMSDMRRQE